MENMKESEEETQSNRLWKYKIPKKKTASVQKEESVLYDKTVRKKKKEEFMYRKAKPA